MTVHASASGAGGKRISQNEFTEKAWQAVVAAPDIAKQYQQQIVVCTNAACPAVKCICTARDQQASRHKPGATSSPQSSAWAQFP